MKQNKRRRERLWAQDPRCHWCGTVTVPPETVGQQSPRHVKDRMATLDHLDHKFSPMRGQFGGLSVPRTVLACRKCNVQRGNEHKRLLTGRA